MLHVDAYRFHMYTHFPAQKHSETYPDHQMALRGNANSLSRLRRDFLQVGYHGETFSNMSRTAGSRLVSHISASKGTEFDEQADSMTDDDAPHQFHIMHLSPIFVSLSWCSIRKLLCCPIYCLYRYDDIVALYPTFYIYISLYYSVSSFHYGIFITDHCINQEPTEWSATSLYQLKLRQRHCVYRIRCSTIENGEAQVTEQRLNHL